MYIVCIIYIYIVYIIYIYNIYSAQISQNQDGITDM